MARVTVEDCKKIIPNHFELVVLASRRARDISTGSPILVERSNDKNAVVALREIAIKKLNIDLIRDSLLKDFRKNLQAEEGVEDEKQENYIEAEMEEGSKFTHDFEDDFAEQEAMINEEELLEEGMSFEDMDLDTEDDK